jgi:hypothetical protein
MEGRVIAKTFTAAMMDRIPPTLENLSSKGKEAMISENMRENTRSANPMITIQFSGRMKYEKMQASAARMMTNNMKMYMRSNLDPDPMPFSFKRRWRTESPSFISSPHELNYLDKQQGERDYRYAIDCWRDDPPS